MQLGQVWVLLEWDISDISEWPTCPRFSLQRARVAQEV